MTPLICWVTSVAPQWEHLTFSVSRSFMLIMRENSLPHFWQRNSYVGIGFLLYPGSAGEIVEI
jgi:hypothetical protein